MIGEAVDDGIVKRDSMDDASTDNGQSPIYILLFNTNILVFIYFGICWDIHFSHKMWCNKTKI